MKAIKSNGGSIVPERSISRIVEDGDYSNVYVNNENPNYGGVSLTFDESSDELAAMLGWNVVNEKGTDGVGARLADLTRERDEALAKLKWLSRWRLQSDVPCPFNGEELIEYRNGDSKGRCYVKDLETSDSWRPLVDQLIFYYAEHKNI